MHVLPNLSRTDLVDGIDNSATLFIHRFKGVRARKFKLVRRDIHMRLKELLSISIHPTQYSSQRKFAHRWTPSKTCRN